MLFNYFIPASNLCLNRCNEFSVLSCSPQLKDVNLPPQSQVSTGCSSEVSGGLLAI